MALVVPRLRAVGVALTPAQGFDSEFHIHSHSGRFKAAGWPRRKAEQANSVRRAMTPTT